MTTYSTVVTDFALECYALYMIALVRLVTFHCNENEGKLRYRPLISNCEFVFRQQMFFGGIFHFSTFSNAVKITIVRLQIAGWKYSLRACIGLHLSQNNRKVSEQRLEANCNTSHFLLLSPDHCMLM